MKRERPEPIETKRSMRRQNAKELDEEEGT